jgi:c-di-GMP-binding flagellar brake protein YcgR
MYSKLETATPASTDDLHVDNWVNKMSTEKPYRERTPDSILDQREFYRLDMKHLPSLDATLISKNGANIDIGVLDLSAGGLCGRITPPVPLFKNQWLTVAFVLPFEEPTLVKTSACLMSIETTEFTESRILHLRFSGGLDDWQKELIHSYIVKKQFELIQRRREWQTA